MSLSRSMSGARVRVASNRCIAGLSLLVGLGLGCGGSDEAQTASPSGTAGTGTVTAGTGASPSGGSGTGATAGRPGSGTNTGSGGSAGRATQGGGTAGASGASSTGTTVAGAAAPAAGSGGEFAPDDTAAGRGAAGAAAGGGSAPSPDTDAGVEEDSDAGVTDPVGTAGTGAAGAGGAAGGVAGAAGGGGAGGTGGVGGSAGAAGGVAGAAGGGENPTREDLGAGDGSDVVLLGDSWMSNTLQLQGTGGGIVPSLLDASDQPYRDYAEQGVMLLEENGFGPAIPTQWDLAVSVNADIKTVVMTGGGNDIIQNLALEESCADAGDLCKQKLAQIGAALEVLWTEMADAGVQDIVFVRYSDDAGNLHPSLRGDGGLTWPTICASGRVRCHSLETTTLVNGELALDDVHPLRSANERIADALVGLMRSQGMRR
ncbi:MAG: hypothetical protein ABW321_18425 [Polyangiales bacterium]